MVGNLGLWWAGKTLGKFLKGRSKNFKGEGRSEKKFSSDKSNQSKENQSNQKNQIRK